MTNSLIDKGKVADKISDLFLDNYPNPSEELETFYKEVLKIVVNEEAQPWVSVKHELPKNNEEVLVWFEYFRYGEYNRLFQTWGIGEYFEKYDDWMINHETGWHKLRVIAWLPIPEPPESE
jgi:hypothetical protein